MEQKLVIGADSYYLDSRGQVRGPLKENNGSSWFEENTLNHWDAAGQPWPSNRDLVTLVEECFVVKHPQDDMPVIPLDNDRKGYMIELLTDYTSDEFEFENEVVYVISQSNVFRYMERLNRFLPMDRPQEFMEYMKRNGSESVLMLINTIKHIEDELAKVKALKTREAFLQISDSARDFVAAMRKLNDSVRDMGTHAHAKIKHIREQMDRAEAAKFDEELTAKFKEAALAPGDKIDYLETPPSPGVNEFAEEIIREIAKTMGVSYEEMVKDYELVTGSPHYAFKGGRIHRFDRRDGLGSILFGKLPENIMFDSNPPSDLVAGLVGLYPYQREALKGLGIPYQHKASDMPRWHADEPRIWSERWQRWIPAWEDKLMLNREETGPRPKLNAENQRKRLVLKNLGVHNAREIGNGMIDAMFKNYSDGIIASTYWNELEQSFNDVLTDNPRGFEFARDWMPVKFMFSDDRLDLYPRPKIGAFYRHRNGNLYEVTGFNNEEHGRQDEYPTKVEYRNYMTGKKYSRDLVDWWRSMKETPVYALKPHEKRLHNRRARYLGHTPEFGVGLESEKLDRGPNWAEVKITFKADPENKRIVGVLAEPFQDIPAGTVMERDENGYVRPARTGTMTVDDINPENVKKLMPEATIVIPKARLTFPNLVDPKQERPQATKFAASLKLDTRDPASRSFMEDLQKTAIKKTFEAREHMLAERASKEIAERVLKGLLVTGFENDRDIEKVLDDQRPLVENSIKRMLLDGDWKKVHAPHD